MRGYTKLSMFILIIFFIIACVQNWGIAWKVSVGILAGISLFFIGVEVGSKTKY